MAIDIGKDIATGVGDVTLVVRQAKNLMKLEIEIDRIEKALKEKKEEYNRLATETLPGLMDTVGVSGLDLTNGYTLELRPLFRASLPAKGTIEKANDEEQPQLLQRLHDGLTWLRKHKATDLIRNVLRMDVGKGQDAAAKQLVALATKLKVQVERSEAVHPASLACFLQEKLSTGTDVPFDTFAVFNGREARIKAPKKSKEK